MVLGMRNKNRRGPSIQVEYVFHVQNIKPWPPTQSLKTVRSVLIHWVNGERNAGSTNSVAPSIEDGKIEFNESFRVPVTLSKDMSVKSGDAYIFHKNLLEFNLYEHRRDRTVKGQLLGTAKVDLADYGVIREVMSVSIPVNCTRSFRNAAQPVLYFRILAYDKGVSLRGKLVKETSLDKNEGDSVSALMNEEYADEAEVASFTDDDISSHSSMTASSAFESIGASPSQNKKTVSEMGKCDTDTSELESSLEKVSSTSHQACEESQQVTEQVAGLKGQILAMSISNRDPSISTAIGTVMEAPEKFKPKHDLPLLGGSERKLEIPERNISLKIAPMVDFDDMEVKESVKHEKNSRTGRKLEEENHLAVNSSSNKLSLDAIGSQVLPGSESPLTKDRIRHVRSVRSSMDSSWSNGSAGGFSGNILRQDANPAEKRHNSDSKIEGLEQRINILERELREAAALEVALYSVVAEHGSSTNKVHTPARRLSRLYLQADKEMKRVSAAQSAVSGLIVVAKACGNDVPRLTFWLSNCVMLRAIISEAFAEEQLPVSASSLAEKYGGGKGTSQISSTLTWRVSSFEKQANKIAVNGSFHDWVDPYAFIFALEKVESWIFSRILESVWWQTLIPHMQSSAAQMIDKVVDPAFQKKYRRSSSSSDQEQVNLSLELWKKAFRDACERLCPLRAGGHKCGCLPVLAKVIMEQCVARLDVAMFNAILRESADDIPTDPVSDPISDPKVLPVPAGKSSFGSGAQLKNTIGNWSRWLTDLFGMDDDDPLNYEREVKEDDSKGHQYDPSFKSFYLLKSLSDLMMLPKDLLLSESIRRQVCPTFGAQIIKRVLEIFVPDEFCPDPIPDAVFEALDAEIVHDEDDGSIMNCPCVAPAVFYSPPKPSTLARVNLGTQSPSQLRRSGSVLRRSNTSDDELDELDSPLHAILSEGLQAFPAQNRKMLLNCRKNAIRYQLLREVWDE